MNANSEEFQKDVNDLISNYITNLKEEVCYRLKHWKFVKSDSVSYNVIQGLLARQASITIDLIKVSVIWNENILPSVLRSMIDLYISMAWIFEKDSNQRAEKYIEYGLGQEKMLREYRARELEAKGDDVDNDPVIKSSDIIINCTLKDELLNINLGNWSNLSVRKMAEEAGCLDFYNLTYIPFSISAHNSWTHLFRFNLKLCNNPLHGTHYVGKINEDTPDFIHYLNLITKYMKKTLALFDENIKIDLSEIKDAYEVLWNDFDNLVSKLDKKGSKTTR